MAKADAVAKDKAPRELSVKEHIYTKIAEFVKEKTGKRIGRTGGREIFDLTVNGVFESAVQEGTLRFNGGFGSLHLRTYQAGTRRLPSGNETTFGERQKLRYEEGVMVKALIGAGGDVKKAASARAASETKGAKSKAKAKTTAETESVDLD